MVVFLFVYSLLTFNLKCGKLYSLMEEVRPQYNFLDDKAIKDMDLALMSKFGFTSLNDVA